MSRVAEVMLTTLPCNLTLPVDMILSEGAHGRSKGHLLPVDEGSRLEVSVVGKLGVMAIPKGRRPTGIEND